MGGAPGWAVALLRWVFDLLGWRRMSAWAAEVVRGRPLASPPPPHPFPPLFPAPPPLRNGRGGARPCPRPARGLSPRAQSLQGGRPCGDRSHFLPSPDRAAARHPLPPIPLPPSPPPPPSNPPAVCPPSPRCAFGGLALET